MDISFYNKRFEQLVQIAQPYRAHWEDVAKNINPGKGYFRQGGLTVNNLPDYKYLLSTKAIEFKRTLAAGMHSGLTSPSRPWFRLTLDDPELSSYQPVKIWLSQCQEIMLTVFNKSNVYKMFHSLYDEEVAFSTGGAMLLPDYNNVIHGYNFTIGTYYLDIDYKGNVNTFGRKVEKTVGALVKEFGLENCSERVKSYYANNNLSAVVVINHIIEPNDIRDPDRKDFKNMPYRSIYWEDGSNEDKVLRVGGFKQFPVIAPRWDVPSCSHTWGIGSPGYYGLGETKGLQHIRKDIKIGNSKLARPPLQAHVNVGNINTLPDGVTRYSGNNVDQGLQLAYPNNAIRTDYLSADYQLGVSELRELFFIDLFRQMENSPDTQKTAREIAEKHEEKLILLGPVIERLNTELHDPMINISFDNLLDAGILPPPPEVLQGKSYGVEYTSILAQAQKLANAQSIERSLNMAASLSQIKPDIMDVINVDEAFRDYCDISGLSPSLTRTAEEVDAMRQDRQQEQEAMQTNQNAMALAQGAKTLADTKMGQGSALDGLMAGVNNV